MLMKDAVLFAMQAANGAVIPLIDDMSDAPFAQPTSEGGNHPLWNLGHLTLVEGIVPKVLFGEANKVEELAPIFGIGTEVVADPGKYPPFAEVRARYESLWQANLQRFESFTEADLDKPTAWQPPRLEKAMPNYGLTFLTLALHKMSHRGQLADARRAAGRKPLFM